MSPRPWPGRRTASALVLSMLLLAASVPAHGLVAARASGDSTAVDDGGGADPAELACVTGAATAYDVDDMSLAGVALTSTGALAVGFASRRGLGDYARRRPAAAQNLDGAWVTTRVTSRGNEDGLVAVAARDGGRAWAVGFTTTGGVTQPLAMRWDERTWRLDRPRPRGGLHTMLTGVTLGRDGRPFAVGYRMTAGGRRQPVAVDRDRTRWRYLDPRTGRRESVTLTGVDADAAGRLWAVGHGGPGATIGPVIYRRERGRWRRMRVPAVPGEAVLSEVVSVSPRDAWAVGYQRYEGTSAPLLLRWDGRQWTRVPGPAFDSPGVLLTAVSAPSAGGIWVVGAAWNEELRSHEAVAALWDGQAWNEFVGIAGGTELHDVAGALDADGWAVGASDSHATAIRICGGPHIFMAGGSGPAPALDEVGPHEDRDAAPELSSEHGARQPSDVSTGGAEADDEERGTVAGRKRAAKHRRGARRHTIPALPAARPDRTVTARDVAISAGLRQVTATFDAIAADFDGDGREDLFIGRHGGPARLVLNREGTFVDHDRMLFPRVDRHGCAAADVDGSGLLDLFCAVGGKRGAGLKANELWIDPGGTSPVDAAWEAGVIDPTGRGRRSAFLRSGHAGLLDLVVTNSPARVDGLPSQGRLFEVRDGDAFVERTRPGFAAGLGSLTIGSGDYDRDGRDDLLLVTGGQQAPRSAGTRLYRNGARGLIDVTRRTGIRAIGEVDAELVDLDSDGRLDLVQLSPTRLRVSLWRRGRFHPVYVRALKNGRAVASGDVNGDRRPDLYVVRSRTGRNAADIMLVNRERGRAFSSMTIPQVVSGDGDDAVAIDHDDNGLADFLVLNGRTRRGPTQLIAFYER